MISGTIYTEPESGCEILIMNEQKTPFGAAYHPRRAGDAIPWHQGCDHCQRGRQPKINLHLKYALLTLMSRKLWSPDEEFIDLVAPGISPIHECKIISSPSHYTVRHWRVENDNHAYVVCPSGKTLSVQMPEDRPLKIKGDGEKRSMALHRGLRLLFSARPAETTEIYAIASFFAHSPKRSSRLECDKIAWSSILSQLTPPKEVQEDDRIPADVTS